MKDLFDILSENGYPNLAKIIFLFWLATVILSWIISQKYTKVKIERENVEITEKRLNLKKALDVEKDKYQQIATEFVYLLESFSESLERLDENDCRDKWYELRHKYFDLYLYEFQKYLTDYETVYCKNKKKLRSYIKTDVFRFLKITSDFYKTINLNTILEICDTEKQHISVETLSDIISFINNSTSFPFNICIKRKLKTYLELLNIKYRKFG